MRGDFYYWCLFSSLKGQRPRVEALRMYKKENREFPGSSVVRTLILNCRGHGFNGLAKKIGGRRQR